MQENKEELVPTEEENDSVESEVDTTNDTDEEVEFDDGEVANKPDEKTTNRNNAKQRLERKKAREQKRLEEENRIRNQARIEGFKEASNNINRFTGEALETDEDVEAYKLMLEIEKDGGDPLEDFYKYSIKKKKAARLEQERLANEQQQKTQNIDKDIEAFSAKYPSVNLTDLLSSNSDFVKVFGADLGKTPLTELYDRYGVVVDMIKKAKNDKAIQEQAINMSSTGALGNNANPPKLDFNKMTSEEFKEWKRNNIKH